MQIEAKTAYYSYLKDLEAMGITIPMKAHNELMKKFPELDEAKAERLINMYIKEEIEAKKTTLYG